MAAPAVKGGLGGRQGALECRICQEEGEEDAMDSPCACTGTLKVNSLSLSGRMFLF
jgi:hypothetical protein